MKFKRKTPEETDRAFLADKADPKTLEKDPHHGMVAAGLSTKISLPGPSDWLGEHDEKGQTVRQFERQAFKIIPHGSFRTIILQPIGAFPDDHSLAPPLAILKDYLEAFYHGLVVEVRKPVELEAIQPLTTRINPGTGKRQLKIDDIRDYLLSIPKANRDIARRMIAIVGVTMEDLYPSEQWNFVFGQAYLCDGVGVFSFARYHPAFFGEEPGPDVATQVLRRCCKVLTHETGHIAGLLHCVFFKCLLNGANHLEELDSQPCQLCPLCLKKLGTTFKWNPTERERALLAFYSAHAGFEEEANFSRATLDYWQRSL
eukprot:TRINITY_DN19223_c0_g1_i1.p2 TRINITY_DN19223_c0_g1~~TRINITY_DN19223_c0_g1_i1.p2  ORF type:complete len:325 (+),score=72.97 TRINITY_DN19223_c0_g1_i1:32-976(+)